MASIFRPGALALISGGASGVGFAFAQHCRRQGMHVALLDINRASLTAASSALQAIDAKLVTLTYEIDVSDLDAWAAVRADVEGKFQTIAFLMLNAGMAIRTSSPWKDAQYFHKTLATNYFGIVHGLTTFLPLVTTASTAAGPAAIVLTGSKQGITNPPGNPAYNASKSAVKTTAEQLAHDLRTAGSSIYAPHVSAHLLVPGWTFTGLSGNAGPVPDEEALKSKPRGAWLASQVAEYGVAKIEAGQFYIICPDTDVDEALDNARMTWAIGDITEGRSALSRWDDKVKDEAAAWIKNEAERRRGN
jgi:NAD(P)-dependent dehydrogenase (short-subunit alcohol dehydrogenase family)